MNSRHYGFTIVEALVSIVVGGIFLLAIIQALYAVSSTSIKVSQRQIANNLSYANLRQFANGSPQTWFTCPIPPAAETDPVTLLSKSGDVDRLPGAVNQIVVADAPLGCDNQMPIRVTSTITYGSTTIRNATYAAY